MTDVLDDMEAVEKVDSRGMFGTLELLPSQIVEASEQALRMPMELFDVANVIVCGMGGSAIGGDLLGDWAADRIPVPYNVVRYYDLPPYAGAGSLVFCVSYSGNTEETLSCFGQAMERECHVVVITSGGELGRRAQEAGVPTFTIPSIKDMPPRLATGYLLFPMAMLCHRLDLLDINGEIEESVGLLSQLTKKLSPDVPIADNTAKIYAKGIMGTTPVIYAPQMMGSLARRWAAQFNENSKLMARWDVVPEMNHNDIEAVGGDDRSMEFSAVLLRDTHEHPRVKSRMEFTKSLMEKRMATVIEVWPRGESRLSRILQHLYMGDCTSLYLAVLRDVDPFDIPTINALKKHLGGK